MEWKNSETGFQTRARFFIRRSSELNFEKTENEKNRFPVSEKIENKYQGGSAK